LNHAFRAGREWRLLCPYDVDALEDETIRRALRHHPLLAEGGDSHRCGLYDGACEPFAGTLPPPPAGCIQVTFDLAELARVRELVRAAALDAWLPLERREDFVLSADELATNSVRHGGGAGTLRLWREDRTLLCEVHDGGHIADPLAGRVSPDEQPLASRGLWLANHLCDLVQIRSCRHGGTTVRLHMRAP
jgi:anti-sigma regulatory factor (Ser/Thr protein kinase)